MNDEILSEIHIDELAKEPIPWLKQKFFAKFKNIFIILGFVLLVVDSLFFDGRIVNLLFSSAYLLLLVIIHLVASAAKWNIITGHMNIYFYADRLEVFRERVWRNRREPHEELCIMYYKDITDFFHLVQQEQLLLKGKYHIKARKWTKDGVVSSDYVIDKRKRGQVKLNLHFANLDNFIREFQKFIPIPISEINMRSYWWVGGP